MHGVKWIYTHDYKKLKENNEGLFDGDVLSKEEWLEILEQKTDESKVITTAVESIDDPEPAYRLLQNTFSKRSYYCPC